MPKAPGDDDRQRAQPKPLAGAERDPAASKQPLRAQKRSVPERAPPRQTATRARTTLPVSSVSKALRAGKNTTEKGNRITGPGAAVHRETVKLLPRLNGMLVRRSHGRKKMAAGPPPRNRQPADRGRQPQDVGMPPHYTRPEKRRSSNGRSDSRGRFANRGFEHLEPSQLLSARPAGLALGLDSLGIEAAQTKTAPNRMGAAPLRFLKSRSGD
jgi:hypothetical protein